MPNENRVDSNALSVLLLLLKSDLMTAAERTKLAGIESGAEVNQDAFGVVKIGNVNITAGADSDTFEIIAGSNITLIPDASNGTLTITAADTTYSAATQSADGLMSKEDKTKLDGVESGADANVIEGVTVNGSAVTPSGKAIALTIPTKVSDITNDSGFQTAQQVTAAINSALANITGISFEVVQTLPSSGTAGKIYLVANSGSTSNAYDEYIYYNAAWEKLGTTDVDLTGYFNSSNLPALTPAEITSIYNTVMGAS